VPSGRLRITGSVKFDPDGDSPAARDFRPILESFGFGRGEPVVLAGSTHDGEEEILAESLTMLRRQFPQARLLIAPRHVERTAKILAQLETSGLRAARRTAHPPDVAPDILILDTTGELRDWYACADVVFIGKSLAGRGGQNPVEAIIAGRPVLFGPHMENFAALREHLLAAGGAIEVRDAAGLAAEIGKLLADPERRTRLVAQATAALQPHRGATARTADLVEAAVNRSDSTARRV
jgi:3-deoxy-D-manno-octulosonic-acid transferase